MVIWLVFVRSARAARNSVKAHIFYKRSPAFFGVVWNFLLNALENVE